MGNKQANDTIVREDNQRITAIHKYITNPAVEIPIAGRMVVPAVIVAAFQRSVDTRSAVLATHSAYKAALVDRTSAEEDRKTFDEGLKAYVLQRFGAKSVEAGEFGYAAKKASEKSAATKAHAVAANLATRKARGTKGKKEKLKIKGVVPETEAETTPATHAGATSAPASGAPHG
jgi:hypothetical protein